MAINCRQIHKTQDCACVCTESDFQKHTNLGKHVQFKNNNNYVINLNYIILDNVNM